MAQYEPEPPTVNSLLIAERIYRDDVSKTWVIAGVFNNIQTSQLPATIPRIEIFFQITNIGKNIDLALRIEHSDGTVIFDVQGPITADSPLYVVENRMVLNNVSFEKSGKYAIQLLSREELLTQAPFYVKVNDEKEDNDNTSDDKN